MSDIIMDKNPNPTKDQHFLVDHDVLNQIYQTAGIQPGESIVEIGGGEGAITDYLIQGNNFVTVIEKDPYYANFLKEKYKNCPNILVVEGDALKFNFSSYDRIVSNLPYTITEPFLINLATTGALDYNPADIKGSKVKSITLVLSQNSTRKMIAPVQITEGNSRHANQEFGIMGAITKAFCDTDIISAIPSDAFFPEPAVTSLLVNLTPKKEKTTVDRILREMLMDKKENHPSVRRIYQTMIAQGKIYKVSKHKNNLDVMSSANSFTSKNIEDKNIYDLPNTLVSKLVQDLIRNDINIKSRNNNQSRRNNNANDWNKYFVGGKFVSDDDYYDEEDFEDTERFTGQRAKFEKKYDYMYDQTQYDILLHRGLENIEPIEFQEMLGKEIVKKSSKLILK